MELKSKKLQNKAVYDQKLNDANKKIFFSIYKNVRDNKKNCYKCDLETIIDNNS